MGLAAALRLAQAGAQVHVLERDDRLGGMSAHFDLAGTRLERYYHFICKPDDTTFAYLREFGLEHRLHWVDTKMGFYFDGALHDWGNPLALLRFPGLNLWQKLRYGLHVMRAKGITDWRPYDAFTSTEWLHRAIGKPAYDVMWKSLFHYKFYEHQDSLSAAWLGTRIRRVALSRRSIFQEQLGYLEGGSETLIDALADGIRRLGGVIELGAAVEEVVAAEAPARAGAGGPARAQGVQGVQGVQCIQGIRIGGTLRPFDAVVSTVPLPYVVRLVPQLPAAEVAKVAAIRNVGVVCVVLKLKRRFTPNFWVNINDPRIQIPGLIEYTNLNPLDGSTIVYAPFYMPHTHPKYARPAEAFVDETLAALALMQPGFDRADVIAATASRYQYAQTVAGPGFFEALPPLASALAGFFYADTSHYYPEDRSISESLRLGERLAAEVLARR